MNITITARIPFEELFEKIRSVPLIGKDWEGKEQFAYKDALVEERKVDASSVNPTTLYLVHKNLAFQKELRNYLLEKYNVDPLNLKEGVVLRNHDTNEEWTLIPPIVEVTQRKVSFHQQDSKEIPYVGSHVIHIPIYVDGQHRAYVAKELGVPLTVLYISNVDPTMTFYAHPNHWSSVEFYHSVPSEKRFKKMYLYEDCYPLYRNFGHIGCGKPRPLGHDGNQDNTR